MISVEVRGMEGWAETFRHLPESMADRFEEPFTELMSDVLERCRDLTHIYPEGATKPPSRVNPAEHGFLKDTAMKQPTVRQGDEVSCTLVWPMGYAEYERLGTRFSIPPYRHHDFLQPAEDATPEFQEVYDLTWRAVWGD